MRLLLETAIVAALIYIGWATPFRDYFPASISGIAKSKPDAASRPNATAVSQRLNASAAPHSTSTPSGAWMWDPSHHSALDRPTPKPTKP
ncbi:MAG TPA: hypothetical protein VEP30_03790 [Chthoniobacterales bacterium]|nr:hypothetical protein [Chthoniobacterales bacterium]